MPGADGSLEITSTFGELNASSTSTTRELAGQDIATINLLILARLYQRRAGPRGYAAEPGNKLAPPHVTSQTKPA